MKKFLILVSVFALAACQQNAPKNQTAQPSPSAAPNIASENSVSTTVSPTAAPSVNAADKTKIKTFEGKGTVTKINLELVSVELNHEEIKGLMPAMTMEFYAMEKSELEQLKVGDKVDFVLEDNQGAEKIVSIKKVK